MAEATAWLLPLDTELRAAVGEREMIHLIQSPKVFEIPDTPPWCRQVLLWQEEIVPILDIAAWLHGSPAAPTPALVGIFAYQTPTAAIAYGALPLMAVPARRWVSDEQACTLPAQPSAWARIALSCFRDGDRVVPILDLSCLFSRVLPQDFDPPTKTR
ncbi:MAG TPA: chemotaxis protein CheW [Thiobacillaceae bacterium]|nr:chemotaxis protein CheW [Thiobacillaceae bacterium]